MPIIYPADVRGVSAGALRQLKQNGHTTACKGLWNVAAVKNKLTTESGALYFNKREPAGEYMEALEQTKNLINENTEAIQVSATKLVETAQSGNKKLAEVTGKMRDGAEKLGTVMDKFMKIAARGDFAETVRLTESLVSSLERLAVLEEKGLLDKVMKAMSA